jgi:iron complex transport system ATP-binding protein
LFKRITFFNKHNPVPGISFFYMMEEKTFLIASMGRLNVLSSAVLGGELRKAKFIVNRTVDKDYNNDRPWEDLRGLTQKMGLGEEVLGMLTAVDVRHTVMSYGTRENLAVTSLCTTGVGNACAAGEFPGFKEAAPGTINTVVLIDGNLSEAAMVNAVITATEGKTRALYESGVRLPAGAAATGTCTDAVVIACTGKGEVLHYAGAATDLGFLIGRTVFKAVRQGVGEYLAVVGCARPEAVAMDNLLN